MCDIELIKHTQETDVIIVSGRPVKVTMKVAIWREAQFFQSHILQYNVGLPLQKREEKKENTLGNV